MVQKEEKDLIRAIERAREGCFHANTAKPCNPPSPRRLCAGRTWRKRRIRRPDHEVSGPQLFGFSEARDVVN